MIDTNGNGLSFTPWTLTEPRTDEQIVAETNQLARIIAAQDHFAVNDDDGEFKFYRRTDVRSKAYWQKACEIMEYLTATSPMHALSAIADDEIEEPEEMEFPVRIFVNLRGVCDYSITARSMDEAKRLALEIDPTDFTYDLPDDGGNMVESLAEADCIVDISWPDELNPLELAENVSVRHQERGEPFANDAVAIVKQLAALDQGDMSDDDIDALIGAAKTACGLD